MSETIMPQNALTADCANDSFSRGQKGVTYYKATSNPFLSTNGSTWSVSWTGTKPRGYKNDSVCNLSFDVAINSNSSSDDVGIECMLNNNLSNSPGTIYHSKIQGHDRNDIIDISQYKIAYVHGGANTLKFTNKSNVGVWINNLRIMREYEMGNLPDSVSRPADSSPPASGSLDGGRNDCPCNYDRPKGNCGGLSVNTWSSWNKAGSLLPYGSTFTWIFKNPGYHTGQTANYQNPAVCFFNFNNVGLMSNSPDNDVQFQINLKGQSIATMYNSRNKDHTSFAGIDLVKFPSLYNDAPNAVNTVQLINKTPSTTIRLRDGEDDGNNAGRINIYRVYNVKKL